MSACPNPAAQIVWRELYQRARQAQRPRVLSPFAEAGGVGAALLAADGSIYTGVCIDMACGLGICAERAAAAQMITCGQSRVLKLAVRMPDGQPGVPCGACCEFLLQMDPENGEAEVLLDPETGHSVKLNSLAPNWWGKRRLPPASGQAGAAE